MRPTYLFARVLARQDPLQEFRLPPTARPVSYKLDLTIRPEEATFRGIAVIAVELKERVRRIGRQGVFKYIPAERFSVAGSAIR